MCLDEFNRFLSIATTTPHEFAITGDFNIHLDNLTDHLTQSVFLVAAFSMQCGLSYRKAVCLSVRLSVTRVCCDKTNEKFCRHSYTVRKIDHSSFLTRRMVSGGRPLPSEILGQTDPPLQNRRFPIDIRS